MKRSIFIVLPFMIALCLIAFLDVNISRGGEEEQGKVSLMALEEISDLIMSPGCDYKYTLTNCPSVQAVELRKLIKSKLVAGETKEEIIQYLVDLYGPKVLASPQKRGFFLLAWWVPYIAIADGALIIVIVIILWRKRSRDDVKTSTEDDPDRQDQYEDRVEEELKKMDF